MNNSFDNSIIKEKERQLWGYDDTPFVILLFIAIYVFVSYIMPTFLILPVNVLGTSMEPTLYENDKVILYKQGQINYGDIIVLYAPDVNGGEDIIKRVMGLPGDTVWFEKETENGDTKYIFHRQHTENGMIIETVIEDEYYVNKDKYGNIIYYSNDNADNVYKPNQKYTLNNDEYFVLGDNRSVSQDSRYNTVGKVQKEQIIGKALLIIRDGKISLFEKVYY